jgi:hypothetical protein
MGEESLHNGRNCWGSVNNGQIVFKPVNYLLRLHRLHAKVTVLNAGVVAKAKFVTAIAAHARSGARAIG